MKQSLQLKLGHHLAMTPQLQQAIRLLQLSTLELHTEIQQILDSNPLLEVSDDDQESSAGNAELKTEERNEKPTGNDDSASDQDWASNSDIPDDLPVDSAWEDVYESAVPSSGAVSGADNDNREIDYQDSGVETLQEHLIWQMRLSHFSETDEAIAMAIIDSINEDGYFKGSLEDITANFSDGNVQVETDEVQAVLHRLQQFDPSGIAARDLQECLFIQLKQLDPQPQWFEQAKVLVSQHLNLLASHDYNQLLRRMRLSQAELAQVIALVTGLNPRPGGQISPPVKEYVIPDVVVRKIKGTWRIELNPEAIPKLRINNHYASLLNGGKNSDTNYLKNQMQEARWFIKSLQSRNETLLKVASCIVEHQRGFLEHGEEAMKALVLHDVAEAVGMHESTISRVTTRKYMHTPRGIFELKYFFSSHVNTSTGGECSATAIRAFIKKMVAEEDPTKPLSDNKIATLLSQRGIEVARRTVAKYREGMAIPPSNERKRLVK